MKVADSLNLPVIVTVTKVELACPVTLRNSAISDCSTQPQQIEQLRQDEYPKLLATYATT